MSVLFHLGHPAHFHLFKNVIKKLQGDELPIHILIKEKDVLKLLMDASGFTYKNILPGGKASGILGSLKDLSIRGRGIHAYCKKHRPSLLVGTSADISYVGKYLGIPTINVNEDDAHIVPKYAWISYPWATEIISPVSCNNGLWSKKTTTYQGYHELAYLHPDNFTTDKSIVSNYLDTSKPYFILRFANLTAHHDDGVRGINNPLAEQLITILQKHGNVFITSERKLSSNFEPLRIQINPMEIHHLMSFAKVVISDSQTMSAEAGVLGTPFIRFNDFVGKIGYLKELEEKYQLGFGINPDHPEKLLEKAEELAIAENLSDIYKDKREKMLSEKINVTEFLYKRIISYL